MAMRSSSRSGVTEYATGLHLVECSASGRGSRAESDVIRGDTHPLVVGDDPAEVSGQLPSGREMDRVQ